MPVPDQDATPPGWDEGWERAWDARRAAGTAPGLVPVRVVRIDKGGITVAATPADKRLVVAAKAVRRVVVGDVCGLDPEAGRIEVILQNVDQGRMPLGRAPLSRREVALIQAWQVGGFDE